MNSATASPFPADLLEQLASGVIVVDDADRITYLNQAAENMLRISRSKAIGQRIEKLFADNQRICDLCVRSRRDQITCIAREIDARPDATPAARAVFDISASPCDAGGLLIEIHDALRLVQINRENSLLAQNDIGQAIVSQLAHEIKNPLGGLRGAAQLLAKKIAGQGLDDYTDVIIREADRLAALVDSMLGPTGPSQREEVNIHRLLDHVGKLLVAEGGAGVHLEKDYDPSLPKISIDENRIIQALLNLGRNALQAVDSDGVIVLRTRALSGFTIGETRHALVLRVDFEDTGPGVPADMIDKMFYPLVTGRAGGTGLGLAVAQDQVHRHAGLIKLIPGERTVFSVFLPFDNRSSYNGGRTTAHRAQTGNS